MKTTLFSLLFLLGSLWTIAQEKPSTTSQKIRLTENSIVKDSTGQVYSIEIWRKLLATGRYVVRPENISQADTHFLLVRLTDEEYRKRVQNLPKPKESNAFKTGQKFIAIKARDINGKKVNTKDLQGKIIVLNYWFIKCPPCIMEIPELNKLTEEYKNDSSIVFISVALDEADNLKDFLRATTFKYNVIPSGKMIAAVNNVKSYPTNAVISPDGKVYFHTSGYSALSTIHWIKKSIEELRQNEVPDETTATN